MTIAVISVKRIKQVLVNLRIKAVAAIILSLIAAFVFPWNDESMATPFAMFFLGMGLFYILRIFIIIRLLGLRLKKHTK